MVVKNLLGAFGVWAGYVEERQIWVTYQAPEDLTV